MRSDHTIIHRCLTEIQDHIRTAENFIAGVTYETLKDDNLRLYAITRCLELISEASRRLPDELKSRHPSLGWSDMAAARIGDPDGHTDVNARSLWETLTAGLPKLREVIKQELQQLGDDTTWITVKIELPDDVGSRLGKVAQTLSLSPRCYCVNLILKHLLEHADLVQKQRWPQEMSAILRRNGCDGVKF